ncbi:hypothetical protein SGPA1_12121 [Streptomyces misionensis JCM 4497]
MLTNATRGTRPLDVTLGRAKGEHRHCVRQPQAPPPSPPPAASYLPAVHGVWRSYGVTANQPLNGFAGRPEGRPMATCRDRGPKQEAASTPPNHLI